MPSDCMHMSCMKLTQTAVLVTDLVRAKLDDRSLYDHGYLNSIPNVWCYTYRADTYEVLG